MVTISTLVLGFKCQYDAKLPVTPLGWRVLNKAWRCRSHGSGLLVWPLAVRTQRRSRFGNSHLQHLMNNRLWFETERGNVSLNYEHAWTKRLLTADFLLLRWSLWRDGQLQLLYFKWNLLNENHTALGELCKAGLLQDCKTLSFTCWQYCVHPVEESLKQRRQILALRQLLRWCTQTDNHSRVRLHQIHKKKTPQKQNRLQ